MRPLMLIPFRGYGTPNHFIVRGRVLRDRGITPPLANDSVWKNFVNMIKRFISAPIGGAHVKVRFAHPDNPERVFNFDVVTDKKGHFRVEFDPELEPQTGEIAYPVELTLVDYPDRPQPAVDNLPVNNTAYVILPSSAAQFGVISDIDDTVLQTDIFNIISMMRNTFMRNARTRLPFKGVAAFYQALRRGTGEQLNPIYYVSSSSWNIYDLLMDFFTVRGIPHGPLFLSDMGIGIKQLIAARHRAHKLGVIQTLLDKYPSLRFILIGDSGQRDPEIYLEAAQSNPGRIAAIYIRDVSGSSRDRMIESYAETALAQGVPMLRVPDTIAAAEHAAQLGFILPEALESVRAESSADRRQRSPIEQALRGDSPGQKGTQS